MVQRRQSQVRRMRRLASLEILLLKLLQQQRLAVLVGLAKLAWKKLFGSSNDARFLPTWTLLD